MRDNFMTVQQICEWLNLKRSFVYQLAGEGKVPCLRVGKLIRFRQSDMEVWVEEHMRKEDSNGRL